MRVTGGSEDKGGIGKAWGRRRKRRRSRTKKIRRDGKGVGMKCG